MLKMLTPRHVAAILTLTVVMLLNHLRSIKAQDVNCDNNPCFNGGTCLRNSNPQRCQCPLPNQNTVYIQPFCTRSCEIEGFSCRNGGTCMDGNCVCPSNTAGPYCESAPVAYLSPLTVIVSEGDEGFTTVAIQVCRQPATQFASFVVNAMPGSADAQDYFMSNAQRTVFLSANTQCSPVTISITNDQRCELTESFTVSLSPSFSSHSVVLGQGTATIFIVDGDSAPTITCPMDITAYSQMGTQQTMVFFGPPTVSDSSATISSTPVSGTFFLVGIHTVMCTAYTTDTAECTTSCTFTVTVIEDTDECNPVGGSPCTTPDICMNTLGSYKCGCSPGYSGDPYGPGQQRTCTDIDECNLVGGSPCTTPDICMNTLGSYQCECGAGYAGDPYGPGQQRTCTDINECDTNMHTCDPNTSDCLNQEGFYACTCKDVFVGAAYIPPSPGTCEADISPPVIERCPRDRFVTVSFGTATSPSNWNEPTATDDSGGTPMLSRSHAPGSSFPVGATTVTYTFEDPAGNQAECIFDVIVQEDCTDLYTMQCDVNMCSCNEERTCDSQTGRCEASCNILECPAVIFSQPLFQVNPQSSVEISCILEGSTAVVNELDIRLSRSGMAVDNRGIGMGPPVITGNRMERTSTVFNVSEEDQFFCMLSQIDTFAAINVTGFLHKLPYIRDEPTEVTRSNTSITISWRPWDQDIDVGDPPVVAYIPYYMMDPSQDWTNGSVIPANLSLKFTASNLESDRNYTFSIATVRVGKGGEGRRGPPVTIKTFCTVPPELLPSSVSTTLTASGDVSVSWKSPENVDCSTGITQFTVYYEIEGDITNRQKAGTTNGTMRSFIVKGSLLESGTMYYFYVTVTTDQEGALSETTEDSQLMFIRNEGSILPIIIGFVAFFIVILILILLIVVVIRKRRKNDSPDPNLPLNDIGGKSSVTGIDNHIYSNPPLSMHVDDDPQGDGGVYEDDNVVPEAEEPSKVDDIYGNLEPPAPIKISEFPEYIVSNSDNLEHEFLILNGANKIHPWTVAELPIHKRKNRFKNMYPYDHSRVVLNRLPDQDHSDYYNASYIVNERNEKTYIACQAPNKASINDFWRMIFEQKVETIAMLTNLYEEGKDRCLRYWPNNELETESFGYINVTWEKTQPCANYDVRTLSVDRGGQIRQIEQLHFKAWPDKLIPDDAMSLVEFAKHCKLLHHGKSSPLLVHCSAGIGRSGTFIALYTMMDVLHTEEYIDVFSYVNKIREDRINMIQTKEQYGYLHTCLYEYYLTKDCQVSANALSHFKLQDSKASIVRQFELLSELETTGTGDSAQGSSSKNRKSTIRDRFGNMVPIMKNRVFLMSMSPSNPDNYINASFVKSFEKKDAFITTQSPLPNTIEDFWRMVYDHKCRTLVMLNQLDSSDKTCVQYWPDRGSLDYGIMTVTCIATEHQTDYTIRKFDVSINNSKEVLSVTHVQFTAWPPQCSAKSTMDAFIDIEKIKQEENDTKPLVVHCINGFERSGVFVTVWSEMERIRATGKVDVFTTVKKLRSEHQHMLRKKMDYVLCFELLISYTQKFGNYENW